MELVFILSAILAGAFWRRWLGGYPKGIDKRWPKVVAGILLGFYCLWPGVPILTALSVSSLFTLYWLPGHKLQEWKFYQWTQRYGPVGIYWWIANKVNIKGWGKAVDGSNAIAEYMAGATIFGILSLFSTL